MNQRILVVDDMEASLGALRASISGMGEVHVASNAGEALEVGKTHGPFAVVLSDYSMPGMNGVELLERFRNEWPATTRILVTAEYSFEVAVEAIERASLFRLIQKPFRPAALRTVVARALAAFARNDEERMLIEQLRFSRDSFVELTSALEERCAKQLQQLEAFYTFGQAVRATRSLEDLADLMVRTSREMFGDRDVHVRLVQQSTLGTIERGTEPAVGAAISYRLRTAHGVVGEARIERSTPEKKLLAPTDLRFFQGLMGYAAVAAQSHGQSDAKKAAQHAISMSLARLVTLRDRETGKHLVRVSHYCRLLGQGLMQDGLHTDVLTDDFIDELARAAPLHDIGKVGVPDSILTKPGALSNEEWEVMRMHPEIGAETIQCVFEVVGEDGFVRTAHDIVGCHHERWDGGGYPHGLAGDEIPLAARIMAVADCYDALTSERPYKHAWTHEEALSWVVERAGTHFDPALIAVVTRCADDLDKIRSRWADDQTEVRRLRRA